MPSPENPPAKPPADPTTVFCPASMCPLTAPNGSPWTGQFNAPCPRHDDLDRGGCPWWTMSCQDNALVGEVLDAHERGGIGFVVGPDQPKRSGLVAPKTFDCPRAHDCSWQHQAVANGGDLCPPRMALALGVDPRVCRF
ncbi:MAG: hypothetical protein IBJ15_00145 [Alphaproteobacteria bacterium]|nr:hypothetical protein [Alphaproteobacteria bacterium]